METPLSPAGRREFNADGGGVARPAAASRDERDQGQERPKRQQFGGVDEKGTQHLTLHKFTV